MEAQAVTTTQEDSHEIVKVAHVASAAVDSIAELAASVVPGQPMKLRIPIHIWSSVKHNYMPWRGQVWKMTAGTIAEAQAIAATLKTLFEVVGYNGWAQTLEDLRAWRDGFVAQAEHAVHEAHAAGPK